MNILIKIVRLKFQYFKLKANKAMKRVKAGLILDRFQITDIDRYDMLGQFLQLKNAA